MNQKERLIELLRKEYGSDVWLGATKCGVYSAQTIITDVETVADYLLSNGVVVLFEDNDNLDGIRDYGVGVEPGERGVIDDTERTIGGTA